MYIFDFSLPIGWEELGVIATLIAVIIALWEATKPRRKRVDMAMVWGGASEYQPYVAVYNLSEKAVVISRLEFQYGYTSIGHINVLDDYHFKDVVIIEPHAVQKINVPVFQRECELADKSGIFIKADFIEDCKMLRVFRITLIDISGKKFHATHKYSKEKLGELIFGQGLFE